MEEHLHLCFGVVAKVLDLCSRKSVTDQQLITGLFDCFSTEALWRGAKILVR